MDTSFSRRRLSCKLARGLMFAVLQAGKRPKVVDRDSHTLDELRRMHAACFQSMDHHVRALNQKFGKQVLFVVPVGQAVMALRGKIIGGAAPGIKTQDDLFTDGLGHPQPSVKVLAACCHFAVNYRRGAAGLPVPLALSRQPEAEELNPLLRHLAWDAVTKHPLSGDPGTIKDACNQAFEFVKRQLEQP